MARGRTSGRTVAFVMGGMLVAMVGLTILLIGGAGTCVAVDSDDGCPHDATLDALRVRGVERTASGGTRVRLEGTRMAGLSDAYVRDFEVSAAPAGVEVHLEPSRDAITLDVPVGATEVEVTLTFGCRQAELGCTHPGTGDAHWVRIRLGLDPDGDGTEVESFASTSGFRPPSGP
jgi:hypothetical protein